MEISSELWERRARVQADASKFAVKEQALWMQSEDGDVWI